MRKLLILLVLLTGCNRSKFGAGDCIKMFPGSPDSEYVVILGHDGDEWYKVAFTDDLITTVSVVDLDKVGIKVSCK